MCDDCVGSGKTGIPSRVDRVVEMGIYRKPYTLSEAYVEIEEKHQ